MRSCTWINTFAVVCIAGFGTACQERSAGAGAGAGDLRRRNRTPRCSRWSRERRSPRVISGPQMTAAERTRLADQVRRVYKDQNYQLIWIDGDRFVGAATASSPSALDAAGDHGLPRALYAASIEDPSAKQERISPDRAPELDATNYGVVPPVLHASVGWPPRPPRNPVAVDVETRETRPRRRALEARSRTTISALR